MKRCTRCDGDKPLTEFYQVTSHFVKKDGTRTVYRMSECNLCNKQRTLQYQKHNKEKVNDKNRRWREQNADSARSSVRNWVLRNLERKSKQVRAWKSRNRHRLTEAERNRNISKRNATPKWADRELMIDVYAEANRRSLETGIKHHVDHVVPIVSDRVCGLHVPENLRVVSATENLKKSNKLLEA